MVSTAPVMTRGRSSSLPQWRAPHSGRRSGARIARDVIRVRRQLRRLNDSYLEADNKTLVRHLIEAGLDDLQTLHDALPESLKRKSWLLTLERHDGWG